MRRSTIGLLTMLVVLSVVGTAVAKENGVELGSSPTGLGPGEPWDVTLQVFADPDALVKAGPPTLTVRNSAGSERQYQTKELPGEPGGYAATVVFPEEGTYTYTIVEHVTGRTYEYDPVVIETPTVAPTAGGSGDSQPIAASASDDGFPLWPVLGGSFGLALVAAGLTVFLRRHRPPASGSGALAGPSTQ